MAASLKIVVLASGRGSNLQALINAKKKRILKSQITAVITNKADAFALERAHKSGIPTYVLESKRMVPSDYNRELLALLKKLTPDLIVLAGYMKILPPELVSTFRGRIINIHPSLLPAFPGLHAQRQALAAGVKIVGCTVHFVDEGCDTGAIILQKCINVRAGDTEDTLSARLLRREHAALVEAVSLIEKRLVSSSILQGPQTLVRK